MQQVMEFMAMRRRRARWGGKKPLLPALLMDCGRLLEGSTCALPAWTGRPCSELECGFLASPGQRRLLGQISFQEGCHQLAGTSGLMRWMKLEPIIQSEVSQKEKHQYSILMHIYGI